MWHDSILELVGDTPLVRLKSVTEGLVPTVLAKVEYFNPGNSAKDRVALQMIRAAEATGQLKAGGTIVEATSGNTGVGVALVARSLGYRCVFAMSDKQSKEKINILKALGAEVVLCPSKVAPEDPNSYYSTAKRISEETPNSVYLNQYDNLANSAAHYATTGPEIWKNTDGRVTHFVATMGTCGTLCGAGKFLKEQNPNIQVIGVDAYGSMLQKAFQTGEAHPEEVYPYLTEAVGKDFVPANFNREVIDDIIKVSDLDGAVMARRLAREESLLIGWSCGSATAGALTVAKSAPDDALIVVLLPDHGSRYLGKIYNDDWLISKGLEEVVERAPMAPKAEEASVGVC